MANESDKSVRALFNEAAELADASKRAAFLDRACRGNADLRRRVEALLDAHAAAGPFLAESSMAPVTEKPGDRIGRYRLLHVIGEGGWGVVYMAEQEEPVRRKVALKIIKLGMDTKSVIARFEVERQALALMDHPNIAKIFDAGVTGVPVAAGILPAGTLSPGRPYFVMELVRGLKITDYCAQYQLSISERLRLFAQVCHAVQHAHQKGIIHRDLKPSNVLVTPNEPDRLGIPKVIDFGIAKATGQELTEKTFFTEFHQFIGTPAYMSPEQAGRSAADIDTRGDIYSLGVLLYELLTGSPPFDEKELLSAGLDGMRRIILEKEPLRPSTRLTQQSRLLKSPIAHRLSPIASDLDWIVMKCLEKDRSRRYETANGLAMDLQRHLNEEPVLARPPSATYRFRKFVRRHKAAFAAAGAVMLALGLGAAASVWQAIRATRAEQLAEQAQKGAEQRLYDALVGEARATRFARRVGFRDEVFALIRQANVLDVPRRSREELRREAAACLGDFVGLTPTAFFEFPTNNTIAVSSTVHLDPTGQLAVFPLSDGSMLLCETATGQEVARLKTTLPAWRCCFDTDGRRLISIHLPVGGSLEERLSGAVVCQWIQVEGRWIADSETALAGAMECQTVGGRTLVITGKPDESSLELRDIQDFSLIQRFSFPRYPHLREFYALPVISPEGNWLAVPVGQKIQIWNLRDGQRSIIVDVPSLFALSSLTFSADGKFLAITSGRGSVIHETENFGHVTTLGEGGGGRTQPAFSDEAKWALPLFEQNSVRFWDSLRNKEFAVLDVPFGPYKAEFSAGGDLLLVAGLNRACAFKTKMDAERLALVGHAQGVRGTSFSPDGSQIASVSTDLTMKIWDSHLGSRVWEAKRLPNQGGYAVGWSPDGRFLATTHWSSQRIWLWNARSGEHLQTLATANPGEIGGVGWSVRFSPDGRHLISAHTPDSVTSATVGLMVWTRQPGDDGNPFGEPVRTLNGDYYNLVLSSDNRHLACVNFFGEKRLFYWDYTGDTSPRVLTGDIPRGGQNVSFTADGRQLVFLDQRRNVVFFDLDAGVRARTFPTLKAARASEGWAGEPNLLLSPDGRKLAISSPTQRGVEIWEAATGRCLYSLPEQAAAIQWLDWSPDSSRVAVSRSDGEIAIWNLDQVERVLNELGLKP